jgi:protein farnesyltransferase subunit beta
MVIISLLNLPLTLPREAKAREYGLQTFTDGLLEYLSRCRFGPLLTRPLQLINVSGQTFEGGISGSPGSEAHGAYAFCALACLCTLGPPEETIPQ